MSDTRIEGGCLCGAVRYRLDRSKVVMSNHCHCRDCQRATGSGFTTFCMVPEADLEMLRGEPRFYEVRGSSGGTVSRGFCTDCGSQLYSFVSVMPGMFFVKAASLDDASWVKPVSSFWVSTAQPWAPADPAIQHHEKNPG